MCNAFFIFVPMINNIKLVSIFLSLLLVSCIKEENKGHIEEIKQSAPVSIINKETFVSIMVDMHLLEGANSLNLVESNKARVNQVVYQELVYKKYGVTKVIFNANLKYYTSDYKQSHEIYERVINELSRLQAANQ